MSLGSLETDSDRQDKEVPWLRQRSGAGLCRKVKKRIAFICVGNSCRSQMAEALARNLSKSSNLEFMSMGTNPARQVEPKALEVLLEEGIIWHGKPKAIQNGEPIDIAVSMGCEVECPLIPGAKRIDWDIADPCGGDIDTYRRTLAVIKQKVTKLLKEIE